MRFRTDEIEQEDRKLLASDADRLSLRQHRDRHNYNRISGTSRTLGIQIREYSGSDSSPGETLDLPARAAVMSPHHIEERLVPAAFTPDDDV